MAWVVSQLNERFDGSAFFVASAETREERTKGPLPTCEKRMEVPSLRCPRPWSCIAGECVALKHDYLVEEIR
jgi:hypothetical protein